MSYASAKAIDADGIPVIDMGPLTGGDRATLGAVGQTLLDAAQSVGFFYVRNHGVPQPHIDRAYTLSRRFFALPAETKQRVCINACHRGFLAVGQARMYDTARVDLKESFIWGPELGLDDPDVAAGKPLMGPNQWPMDLPEFAPALTDYSGAVMECARTLLRGFAVSSDSMPISFASASQGRSRAAR